MNDSNGPQLTSTATNLMMELLKVIYDKYYAPKTFEYIGTVSINTSNLKYYSKFQLISSIKYLNQAAHMGHKNTQVCTVCITSNKKLHFHENIVDIYLKSLNFRES